MKHAPGITRRGTAAELAAHKSGYVASGESMWSREKAAGRLAHQTNTRITEGMPLPLMIETTKAGLRKLERDLLVTDSAHQTQRINRSISLKGQFLRKLQQEYQDLVGESCR
jgi:hypothetical protein